MNKMKFKVILAGLVLLFAIVASFGTTYAWFTVSNIVNIDSMTLTVESGESLLIRVYKGEYEGDAAQDALDEASLLDASLYLNTLTITDIKASTKYSGFDSYRLVPVTAAVDDTYGALNGKELKTMSVLTKALTETATYNSSDGDFIELKFWVMAQVTDENIVLSDLSITVDPGTNLLDAQDNVIDAVNLAAWKSQEKAVAVITDEARIYSTNPDYGFAFTAGMKGASGYPGANAPYILTAQQITDLLGDHSLFFGASTVGNVSTSTLTSATTLASLSADTPTLITVRIYIEGWDAQMTNAILSSKFDISFGFTIKNAD